MLCTKTVDLSASIPQRVVCVMVKFTERRCSVTVTNDSNFYIRVTQKSPAWSCT